MKSRIYPFRSLHNPKGTGLDLGAPWRYFPGAPAGGLGNLRMFANKRTGGAAASGKKKQTKHAGSAAASAGKSVDVQDGAARFLPKAPAANYQTIL